MKVTSGFSRVRLSNTCDLIIAIRGQDGSVYVISFLAAFVAGCVSGLGIIQDACVPHKNHRKHSGASGTAGR